MIYTGLGPRSLENGLTCTTTTTRQAVSVHIPHTRGVERMAAGTSSLLHYRVRLGQVPRGQRRYAVRAAQWGGANTICW